MDIKGKLEISISKEPVIDTAFIMKSKYGQNCLICPPYKYFGVWLKNKKVTDFLEILAFFWPNFSRAAIILQ